MIAAFRRHQRIPYLLPIAVLLLVGAVFLVDARVDAPPDQASSPSAVPGKVPPAADAAITSASAWMALFDAGDCGGVWSEVHSAARAVISRDAFAGLCGELRRSEAEERGSLVTRRPAGVEYIPNLPMSLGTGISVVFRSKYKNGEHPGPKLLLALDTDGRWRIVRSDKQ